MNIALNLIYIDQYNSLVKIIAFSTHVLKLGFFRTKNMGEKP